jgi:hypothetical protein
MPNVAMGIRAKPQAEQIDAVLPQQLGFALQGALQTLVDVSPVALQARQIDSPAYASHEPLEVDQIEEGVVFL